MAASHGTPPRLPDLSGRCYVITGGTGGLGYWASEQLASAGAQVVIAARSAEKGEAALASISARVPGADARFVRLDLADLGSVEQAAAELDTLPRVDALIANAGILSSKGRQQTADGFESMMGTNLLGHFALIGRMLPGLTARASGSAGEDGASGADGTSDHGAPSPRIVHLGSISHEFFRLDLDDLQATSGRFREFRTYGRSKLAVMTFAFELDRRLRAARSPVASLVAHPGFAVDELDPARAILPAPKRGTPVTRAAYRLIGQGKHQGAWPIVAAATSPEAAGGQYWGPDGWRQLRGAPTVVSAKQYSRDPAVARPLWAAAEALTGVHYPLPA